MSDAEILPNNTHTYLREALGSTLWLDHVIATNSAHFIINHMHVTYMYDCISSDLHAIMTEISLNNISLQSTADTSRKKECIKWYKVKTDDTLQYKLRTEIELSKVHIHILISSCVATHIVMNVT